MRGLKICTNGHVLLNKMATMPIYMIKTLINLLQSQAALRMNLGIQHLGVNGNQICTNDDLRLNYDFFKARSSCVLKHFLWGKYWKIIFSKCPKMY